jgi:hypothetical protein
MAAKKKKTADADAGAAVNGYQIFKKQGTSGHRVALNLETGHAVEEDGHDERTKTNRFFIYLGGRQHPIQSPLSLEEIVGGDAPEDAAVPEA